jgi:hypothetical protein
MATPKDNDNDNDKLEPKPAKPAKPAKPGLRAAKASAPPDELPEVNFSDYGGVRSLHLGHVAHSFALK